MITEAAAALDALPPGDQRRRQLLKMLDRSRDDRAVEVLGRYMRSSDDRESAAAAEALQKLATDNALDALADGVIEAPPLAAGIAALALSELRGRAALPVILRGYEQRAAGFGRLERWILVQALAKNPHRSAVPALASALHDKDRKIRNAAAAALTRIHTPESRAALVDAATSQSWWFGRYSRKGARLTDTGEQ